LLLIISRYKRVSIASQSDIRLFVPGEASRENAGATRVLDACRASGAHASASAREASPSSHPIIPSTIRSNALRCDAREG